MDRILVALGLACGLAGVLGGGAVGAADIQNNYNGAYLEGRSFAKKDLRQAKFYKASLRDVDFSGADLRGASFFAASMRRVNLQGTRLDYSELSNADLQEAKLDQAVLTGSYLTAAKLKNISIVGADFTDTILNNQQKEYLCQRASGRNTRTHRETRTTLGC